MDRFGKIQHIGDDFFNLRSRINDRLKTCTRIALSGLQSAPLIPNRSTQNLLSSLSIFSLTPSLGIFYTLLIQKAIQDEVIDLLDSDKEKGLELFEIGNRQKHFGPNAITGKRGKGPLLRFLLQFRQPLIYILLSAGTVTALLQEWVDACATGRSSQSIQWYHRKSLDGNLRQGTDRYCRPDLRFRQGDAGAKTSPG
ncbi:MAG: hypothetical protein EHM37_11890 [Deltaproteobacteria bacterium]|nr:MAG: hypothetical protein EHM37_11890 [Deltaproteobacteria bacterium]